MQRAYLSTVHTTLNPFVPISDQSFKSFQYKDIVKKIIL